MPHISKEELPKEQQRELERQFVTIMRQASGGAVLDALLTEVESVMLAKRLAALLMLIDEQSYYRIEQVLGMSTSTIKRLDSLLIGGAYAHLESYATNKKNRAEIMKSIGKLLRGGLPPRAYIIKKRRP